MLLPILKQPSRLFDTLHLRSLIRARRWAKASSRGECELTGPAARVLRGKWAGWTGYNFPGTKNTHTLVMHSSALEKCNARNVGTSGKWATSSVFSSLSLSNLLSSKVVWKCHWKMGKIWCTHATHEKGRYLWEIFTSTASIFFTQFPRHWRCYYCPREIVGIWSVVLIYHKICSPPKR